MSALTSRRRYANSAAASALSVGIDAAVTSYTLTTATGFPPVPFTATLDYQGSAEEVVLVTGLSGTTVTNCVRGYDATAAQSHALGTTFVHSLISQDLDEANDHTSSTAAHGTASGVVGLTDAQTLTNKVISSSRGQATVTDPAFKVQANASGTAQLFEAYDSAGTGLVARFGRAGDLFVTPNDPARKPLVLKAAPSQSANIFDIQDTAASPLWVVNAKGQIIHRPADVAAAAIKYVPPSATPGTFLALRDTGDAADLLLLSTAGEITAVRAWLTSGSADPLRYPADGSKFKVDNAGNIAAANGGGRVGHNIDSTPFSAAGGGATEGIGHSHGYPVVNGRRYRFTANFQTSAASGVTLRQMTARFSSGAVTNVSNLIFLRQSALTGALRDDRQYTGEFVATATATWNVALGIMTAGGAGNTTVDASEVFLDDVGI